MSTSCSRRFARQLVPREVRIQEDETQVVHVAVKLPVFQQPGVVFGATPPLSVTRSLEEFPHHAGEEAAAPIGPQLAAVMPAAAGRVDRKKVGGTLDRGGHLPLSKIESPPRISAAERRAWRRDPGICWGLTDIRIAPHRAVYYPGSDVG